MAVSVNDLVAGPLTPAVGVTTISVDYFVENAEWLSVYKTGSRDPLVLGVNYTFAGEGTTTGVITLAIAANGTDRYAVYLTPPLERATDMQLRGGFRSEPFNVELDRIWQAIQMLNTRANLALSLGRTSVSALALQSESLSARSRGLIYFDNGGSGLEVGPTGLAGSLVIATATGYTNGPTVDSLLTAPSADNRFTTVAELKAYNGTDLVVGSTVEVLQGNYFYTVVTSGQNMTTAGGDKLKAIPRAGQIDPLQVGATGDGATDDTVALQAAADAAAAGGYELLLLPAGYTFLHTALLIIRNGTKAVTGQGGILLADNDSCGILLAGIQAGESANVTNCNVHGLKIDGGGYSINAIHGQNLQSCDIFNNYIYNVVDGYGILCRTYLAGARNTVFVNIHDNRIVLNANSYGVSEHAIALDVLNAELNYSPYASETEYWENTFTAAVPTYYADRCSVVNNTVVGGYYGCSLAATRNTVVLGNLFQSNTRGVSAQHGCFYNTISDNRVLNCASSGIHLNFGSRFNVIANNRIVNLSNGGEALIQCSLGCSDNAINGNSILTQGSSGNQFFIYIGPKASRCHVEGNLCSGPVERTGICAESEWNPAVTEQYGYAYGKTIPNAMSDADLTAVVIRNNVINLSFVRPAIMLSAVTRGTDKDVTGCVVDGNTVIGTTPYRQFQIHEYLTSEVSTLQLVGNKFADGASAGTFIMPRGRLHFSNRANNNVLDDGPQAFGNGDTSPDVSFGNGFYYCVNGGATSITTFDGAAAAQEILVKLDANTTLVHNSAVMRLKGGVNLVASSSDQFVALRKFAGIWFEIARNF
jgi:parallel beta-helix repeat protein